MSLSVCLLFLFLLRVPSGFLLLLLLLPILMCVCICVCMSVVSSAYLVYCWCAFLVRLRFADLHFAFPIFTNFTSFSSVRRLCFAFGTFVLQVEGSCFTELLCHWRCYYCIRYYYYYCSLLFLYCLDCCCLLHLSIEWCYVLFSLCNKIYPVGKPKLFFYYFPFI